MTRLFDFIFAALGLLFTAPIMLLILLLSVSDDGALFFRQERLGRKKILFTLIKFRTMVPHTESVATHLANPDAITRFGHFLRRSKLDELPQLYNVLKGDMSLVGPRPNLPNQVELIKAREKLGVFDVRPGITGLAQVNGIDMSKPEILADIDAKMLATMSVRNYFLYVLLTLLGKGQRDGIKP